MKYGYGFVLLAAALLVTACAGDSSKKNANTASKQAPVPSTRCPAGTTQDSAGNCMQQGQTASSRRTPVRDTLGRITERPFPDMSLPTNGGILQR